MRDRIVITGIGVVAPIGMGAEAFWTGLENGHSGIQAGLSFPNSGRNGAKAAPVRDFQPARYFSQKGLACLSRTAEMACAAASLALANSRLDRAAIDPTEVGVVLGTAYGNLQSMVQFSEGLYKEGPRFVNPMLFPNTVINSAAGYVSILLGNQGINVTLSSGICSGMDAVLYAAAALQRGEGRIMFAGGADELSLFTYAAFQHSGQLAGSCAHDGENSVPFDFRRNGFVLGEGAAMLVLERLDQARARRAPIQAELAGWGRCFIPNGASDEKRKVLLQAKAMRQALARGGLTPSDISYVAASANGSVTADRLEAKAIRAVFRDQVRELPVSAFKSMLGEGFGATAAAQIAGAVLSLQGDVVPPTIHFQAGDADTSLDGICAEKRVRPCRAIMVNSFNPLKNSSTVIIKKMADDDGAGRSGGLS